MSRMLDTVKKSWCYKSEDEEEEEKEKVDDSPKSCHKCVVQTKLLPHYTSNVRTFMHKDTQKYADAATFLHSSDRDNNEKEQSIW